MREMASGAAPAMQALLAAADLPARRNAFGPILLGTSAHAPPAPSFSPTTAAQCSVSSKDRASRVALPVERDKRLSPLDATQTASFVAAHDLESRENHRDQGVALSDKHS